MQSLQKTILLALIFAISSCTMERCEIRGMVKNNLYPAMTLGIDDRIQYRQSRGTIAEMEADIIYLTSTKITDSVAEELELNLKYPIHIPLNEFSDGFRVEMIPRTDLVNLFYDSDDEDVSKKVIDTWIKVLLAAYTKEKELEQLQPSLIDVLAEQNIPKIIDRELEYLNDSDRKILLKSYKELSWGIYYEHPDIVLLQKVTASLFETIVNTYGSEIEVVATTSDKGFSKLRLQKNFQSYIRLVSNADKVCSEQTLLNF